MMRWLNSFGVTFGIGLLWAIGWAMAGVIIAIVSASLGIPEESGLDPWIALALPGFLGGVIFAILLGVAERRRRINELPLQRLIGWGALSGLLLSLLPFALVAAGAGSFNVPPGQLAAIAIPSSIMLSAASAVGSTLVFRLSAQEQPGEGAKLNG